MLPFEVFSGLPLHLASILVLYYVHVVAVQQAVDHTKQCKVVNLIGPWLPIFHLHTSILLEKEF